MTPAFFFISSIIYRHISSPAAALGPSQTGRGDAAGCSADIYSLPPSIIKEPSFGFAHNYTRRYGLNSPALNPSGAGPSLPHRAAIAQGPSYSLGEVTIAQLHTLWSLPSQAVAFPILGWGLCTLAVCVKHPPISVHTTVSSFSLFDSAQP